MQASQSKIRHPFRPMRGRWQWQLLGLAVGALLAVGIAPGTGWMVRTQAAALLSAGSLQAIAHQWQGRDDASARQTQQDAAAAAHPQDVSLQIADTLAAANTEATHSPNYRQYGMDAIYWNALPQDTLRRLQPLLARFPQDPRPCAVYLRYACEYMVNAWLPGRGMEKKLKAEAQQQLQEQFQTSQAIGAFAAIARQGERCDPDNAFFPMLLAAADFAAGSNRAGMEDVARAAEKSRWEDYTAEETRGKWRLDTLAFGTQSSIAREHADNGIYLEPARSQLEAVGSLIYKEAIAQEQAGNSEAGIALRGRLQRVAALWRDQARNVNGLNNGIGLFKLGGSRPAGQMLMPASLPLGASVISPDTALSLGSYAVNGPQNLGSYTDFLIVHHHLPEAQWVAQQQQRNQTLLNGPKDEGEFAMPLTWRWLGSQSLLAEGVLFLLFGGPAAIALYRQRFRLRAPQPLARPVVRGILLGLVCSGALFALTGFLAPDRLWSSTLPFLLCAGACALLARYFEEGAQAFLRALALTLLSIVGLHALAMAIGAFAFLHLVHGWFSDSALPASATDAAVFALLLLIPPTAVALLLMIGSRVRRVPVSVGVVRGLNSLTVPLLALLIFAYVGLVFSTIRLEAQTRVLQEKRLDNERRFNLEQAMQ